MLKIAVVGNSYQEAKSFVEYKFGERISQHHATTSRYTLTNGDELYLCYGEPDMYNSVVFDAFILTPRYETLFDVIRYRTARP